MPDDVTAYARAVVDGKIVAGPYVRGSSRRHLADLEKGEARGLRWDPEAADYGIGFYHEVLRLSEGQFEGEPFILQPSQRFIIGSLFGWKRKDGYRRFRRAYIEEGKGNGKSPMAAGAGLLGMVADGEPGAQIFAAAAKMEQAHILFQDAVKMVRQSPDLEARITPTGVNPVHNLAYLQTGSFFRPLGQDTGKTGSGHRPHFALVDELHEHPNRLTLEILERGFKFRRQPLLLMITNSGSDRNSVCWEEHEHACKVATGEIEDDNTFSYVCALDEGDDPLEDPSCWIKANPLLGVTITESYLADVVAQANAIPARRNLILRLHFCVWTEADAGWIAQSEWEACEDPEMCLEDFEGQECWLGLDLGATRDMTGLAMVFRDGVDDEGRQKYALFAHGFTPKETLQVRVREDKAPYDVWVDQGFLTATPGKVIRLDHLAADVVSRSNRFLIAAIAYDLWLMRDFAIVLDELGVTLPLLEHPQSIHRRKDSPLWMPDSIKALETAILERRLRIAVNPALRSAVMSTAFWESPAGLRRFEKKRATARIDLAVASAMAMGAATAEATPEPSYQMLIF